MSAVGTIQIPAVRSDVSAFSLRTFSSANYRLPAKPARKSTPEIDETKTLAVAVIEEWWWRVRNRQIFKILKEAIRSSENSLTDDIIRKLSPNEAELLRDPTMKARIKFRFGGDKFPPFVVFKIFISGTSGRVRYFSGKKLIQPASNAAEDARQQMGNRVFYDQMLTDACQQQQLRVGSEVDVTNMKEYMQYVAAVDEAPAYLGGKDNSWRMLNLDKLPRHSVMYGVMELLEQSRTEERGVLGKFCGFVQSHITRQQYTYTSTTSPLLGQRGGKGVVSQQSGEKTSTGIPSRGSRQARHRVRKMRQTYTAQSHQEDTEEMTDSRRGSPDTMRQRQQQLVAEDTPRNEEEEEEEGEREDSDWEGEAWDLYQWTQKLSFEEDSTL